MRKFLENASEIKKMTLLASLVGFVICLIFLVIGLTTNLWGWLFGALIGTFVEIINIVLLFVGSDFAIKKFKPFNFLFAYFGRMILYILSFVICAWFQFGLTGVMEPLPLWNYALWGDLIAISPLQIIIIAVMVKNKKSPLSIGEIEEEKHNEEVDK